MTIGLLWLLGGGLAQWLASRTTDKGVPSKRPCQVAGHCGLEQFTFTPGLVPLLVKPSKAVDVQLTWTDCDGAGDYVVPNVLSPRDLVSRPDNMDETVLHTHPWVEGTKVCMEYMYIWVT